MGIIGILDRFDGMCRDFIQFNRIYRDLMGFYRD